jgi:glycosyltransferase involved in cell wall biosynthesis
VRLLLVVHGFPPDASGGTELHTATAARELARAGHDVFVFAARRNGPSEDRVWEGVQVHTVRVNVPEDFAMLVRNENVRHEFERFMDEVSPDLVHVQHLLYLSADLIEAARARDLPVVVTLHDFWFQCPQIHLSKERHPLRGTLWGLACMRHHDLRPLRRGGWLLRRGVLRTTASRHLRRARFLQEQLRLANCVISPSGFLRERFVRFGVDPERIVVVPHPTGLMKQRPTHEQGAPVEFGFIGAITRDKGVHELCQAFVSLPGEERLRLWGDCEDPAYLDSLQPYLGDRVSYQGPFDHSLLGDVLAGLDVLVVPSLVHESFSLVALEARTAGLPVVASDVGALSELIEDGTNGLLVPPGDVGRLAAALNLLRDHATLASLGTMPAAPTGPATYARHLEELYVRAAVERDATRGREPGSPRGLPPAPVSCPAQHEA